MYSVFPKAILLLLLLCAVAHSSVIVSTSASCGSPPASPLSTNDAASDPSNATAISDLDCIFGGENTGFSTAVSTGSISGSTHVDLAVTGLASADTDFMLVRQGKRISECAVDSDSLTRLAGHRGHAHGCVGDRCFAMRDVGRCLW